MRTRTLLLVAAVLLAQAVTLVLAGRDFYKILGVARSASKRDIKKAYRKLAMEFHPDKNPSEEAAQKFQDIGAAYEALSDDERRKVYDKRGEEGLANSGQQHDPFDMFSSMFGGGNSFFNFGGGGGRGERQVPRGADISIDLDVTLEDLYNGQFLEIMNAKPVPKQAPGTRKCNCRMEMRTQQLGPGQYQMMNVKVCDDCPNIKMVTEYVELDVEIEPGMIEGQEIVYHGEGEPHVDGEPGDLKFRITTLKHPRFERRGNDLLTNVTISLVDALTGFKVDIPHLDGHNVHIKRDDITAQGMILRVSNQGMKSYENNHVVGDLYITFDVKFPAGGLSAAAKEEIRKVLQQSHEPTIYNGLEAQFVPS